MSDTARHVTIHGRVQGVFFRDSTRRRAHKEDVAGWIRNNADGTVEARLEGEESAVAGIERWMREGGPPRARVERVDAETVEPEGHDGFRVAR